MHLSKPWHPFVRKWKGEWFIFIGRTRPSYGAHPYPTRDDAIHAARRIAIQEANR